MMRGVISGRESEVSTVRREYGTSEIGVEAEEEVSRGASIASSQTFEAAPMALSSPGLLFERGMEEGDRSCYCGEVGRASM